MRQNRPPTPLTFPRCEAYIISFIFSCLSSSHLPLKPTRRGLSARHKAPHVPMALVLALRANRLPPSIMETSSRISVPTQNTTLQGKPKHSTSQPTKRLLAEAGSATRLQLKFISIWVARLFVGFGPPKLRNGFHRCSFSFPFFTKKCGILKKDRPHKAMAIKNGYGSFGDPHVGHLSWGLNRGSGAPMGFGPWSGPKI